ncbi:unnamed protein product [Brassica oleracea var. botrytis]|uniref:ACT-like domain-containing protein n=2 Tax=Brassica TaxID=3705 RepID=A0A0D3DSV0_BRAOL|nr:unnamed protein product [Brassica napus]
MAARSRDTETGDQEDDIHGHNYCQIFNMTHHTVVLHMQTNTKRLFLLLSCRKILEALRNSMGGRSSIGEEFLYQFSFPERHGALMNFLDSFSPRWNISLFHNKPIGWGRHERAGQDPSAGAKHGVFQNPSSSSWTRVRLGK